MQGVGELYLYRITYRESYPQIIKGSDVWQGNFSALYNRQVLVWVHSRDRLILIVVVDKLKGIRQGLGIFPKPCLCSN